MIIVVSSKKISYGALAKEYHQRFHNPFSNFHMPVVKRVFPSLIAQEIVSTQPMSLPSGLLFHLDYTYGKQKITFSNRKMRRNQRKRK